MTVSGFLRVHRTHRSLQRRYSASHRHYRKMEGLEMRHWKVCKTFEQLKVHYVKWILAPKRSLLSNLTLITEERDDLLDYGGYPKKLVVQAAHKDLVMVEENFSKKVHNMVNKKMKVRVKRFVFPKSIFDKVDKFMKKSIQEEWFCGFFCCLKKYVSDRLLKPFAFSQIEKDNLYSLSLYSSGQCKDVYDNFIRNFLIKFTL